MAENGKLLTRDELLGKCQRRYRYVDLPSGGRVQIQSLVESEYAQYELPTRTQLGDAWEQAMASHRRRLIIGTVVAENKQRVFKATDVKFIEDMDAADAQKIFVEAWDHCGIGANAVKAASKNSDGGPENGPPDGSQQNAEKQTSTSSSTA